MASKNIKTPGNIKFGDMPAEYRMKYLKMIEKKNKEDEEKNMPKMHWEWVHKSERESGLAE